MSEVIFDRFKQANSTLRREKEGSGIGLSIVKTMIEMHDGTVLLDSDLGKGSEFIIRLPIRKVDNQKDSSAEYMDNKINVDRIHIEFSDIYELNHIY